MRIPFISLIAGSALALGGCAYGGLGMGLGYGDPYSSYGYGSPYGSLGYGYGSPYYGYGYGSPYGSLGYGSPYGWYDGFYYPGTGYYVYDAYRQPHVWSSTQRTYWASRQPTIVTTSGTTRTRTIAPNWSGFTRPRTVRTTSVTTTRPTRTERLEQRAARRLERQTQSTDTSTTIDDTRPKRHH